MRRLIRRHIFAAAAGLTLLFAAGPAHADCLPWKQAGPIIAKNALLPGDVIYQMVQSRTGGKIIHASLCEEEGRFFYKLVVLGAQGEVSNVTVDALTGQP